MKRFFGTAGTLGTTCLLGTVGSLGRQPAHSVHSVRSVARYTRYSRYARYNRSSRILRAVAVVEGGFFEIEFTKHTTPVLMILKTCAKHSKPKIRGQKVGWLLNLSSRVLLPVRNSIYVALDRYWATLSEATRKQRSGGVDSRTIKEYVTETAVKRQKMPVRCVAVRGGNTGDSHKGVEASKKYRFFVS